MKNKISSIFKKQTFIFCLIFGCINIGVGQSENTKWDTTYSPLNKFITDKNIVSSDSLFGMSISYYTNGEIEYIVNTSNGKLHGTHLFFNDNGALRIYKCYENGEVIYFRIYHDDSVESHEVKNGVFEGKYTEKDNDGNIIKEGYYHGGKLYVPIDSLRKE